MHRCFHWFLLAVFVAAQPTSAGTLSNRRAPGFSLPDIQLQQHDLQDYRGKLVLLTIMRTDCPHCSSFSKALGAAQEKYGNRIQTIGIVNTPPDTQATVRNYLSQNGIDQLILFDCRQVAISYLKLSPQRPSFDVPHLFIIDANGWIQDDHGYNALTREVFSEEGLFKLIDKHLGESAKRDGAGTAAVKRGF